ncbi:hypothetical protein FBUS_06273, partial [Fasciolopsis buskii]
SIADLLNWDVDDATRCLSVYAICEQVLHPSSHIPLDKPIEIRAFRDCFKYTVDNNALKSDSENLSESVSVEIRPDDSTSRFSKIGAVVFTPYLLTKQSYRDLIELISPSVLDPTILVYALTCHILHRDCSRHITSLIRRVHQLYAFLLLRFCESEMTCSRSAQRNSSSLTEKSLNTTQQSDESIAAHNSFRLLWDKLHDFVLTSSQLSSAYLLSLVFRSLLYQAWESVDRNKSLAAAWKACAEDQSDAAGCAHGDFLGVNKSDNLTEPLRPCGPLPSSLPPTDDIQSVALEPVGRQSADPLVPLSTLTVLIEQWHDTCARMEDLFTLGLLVQLPLREYPNGEREQDVVKEPQVFPITLRRALTCGRACLTELFASWLVHWHIQPDELISFYQNICPSTESSTAPSECTELALPKSSDLVTALLPLVYKRLPFTLELDVVMASVCWIHYQRWLSDAKAQQKSEVVPVFSVEREWSNLTESSPFLNEDASRSRVPSDNQTEEPFSPSPEWIARSVSRSDLTVSMSHSLIAEIAVNYCVPPSPEAVALWEQSAIVIAALSTFSLVRKRSRSTGTGCDFYTVQDFFPHSNANSLFANRVADWAAQPLRYEPDSGLDNRRRLFITWLVDCAVRSYEKSFEAWPMDPSAQSVSSNDSRKSKSLTTGSPSSHENLGRRTSSALDVYSMFTTAATTLARHWGLSRDTVIVQHVVALFEANLDEQAELYLCQVEDCGSLATRLLIVVGRRVAWYCFGANNPEIISYQLRWRACIPFELESWLRGLQSETVSHNFRSITNESDYAAEFNRLICLIDYVLDRIPSHASQIRIAESLRDAIYAMHEEDC